MNGPGVVLGADEHDEAVVDHCMISKGDGEINEVPDQVKPPSDAEAETVHEGVAQAVVETPCQEQAYSATDVCHDTDVVEVDPREQSKMNTPGVVVCFHGHDEAVVDQYVTSKGDGEINEVPDQVKLPIDGEEETVHEGVAQAVVETPCQEQSDGATDACHDTDVVEVDPREQSETNAPGVVLVGADEHHEAVVDHCVTSKGDGEINEVPDQVKPPSDIEEETVYEQAAPDFVESPCPEKTDGATDAGHETDVIVQNDFVRGFEKKSVLISSIFNKMKSYPADSQINNFGNEDARVPASTGSGPTQKTKLSIPAAFGKNVEGNNFSYFEKPQEKSSTLNAMKPLRTDNDTSTSSASQAKLHVHATRSDELLEEREKYSSHKQKIFQVSNVTQPCSSPSSAEAAPVVAPHSPNKLAIPIVGEEVNINMRSYASIDKKIDKHGDEDLTQSSSKIVASARSLKKKVAIPSAFLKKDTELTKISESNTLGTTEAPHESVSSKFLPTKKKVTIPRAFSVLTPPEHGSNVHPLGSDVYAAVLTKKSTRACSETETLQVTSPTPPQDADGLTREFQKDEGSVQISQCEIKTEVSAASPIALNQRKLSIPTVFALTTAKSISITEEKTIESIENHDVNDTLAKSKILTPPKKPKKLAIPSAFSKSHLQKKTETEVKEKPSFPRSALNSENSKTSTIQTTSSPSCIESKKLAERAEKRGDGSHQNQGKYNYQNTPESFPLQETSSKLTMPSSTSSTSIENDQSKNSISAFSLTASPYQAERNLVPISLEETSAHIKTKPDPRKSTNISNEVNVKISAPPLKKKIAIPSIFAGKSQPINSSSTLEPGNSPQNLPRTVPRSMLNKQNDSKEPENDNGEIAPEKTPLESSKEASETETDIIAKAPIVSSRKLKKLAIPAAFAGGTLKLETNELEKTAPPPRPKKKINIPPAFGK
jgi:hypothetical protein